MSEQNLEIVRRALELLHRSYLAGELEPGMLELCAPDVRVDASRRVFNPDIYEGHDGLRQMTREIWEAWDGFTVTNERVEVAGDRVVALDVISGRGRASRVEVRSQGALIWALRDGRVVLVELFPDHAQALAAAGIE